MVEAGLGGARDATNVFGAPGPDLPPGAGLRLAIITAIGLEHQAAARSSQMSLPACYILGLDMLGLQLVWGFSTGRDRPW